MEVKLGQTVEQYVHRVTDFSASFGSKMSASFNPHTIIGPPPDWSLTSAYTKLRSCCRRWRKEALSSPEEFIPQNGKIQSRDFVEVSFKEPVYPQEVSVFETFNLGALVKIWALGPTTWEVLWEGEPKGAGGELDFASLPMKQVNFPTQILRLEFNHQRLLPYLTELNAVLLKGQKASTCVHIERPNSFTKQSQPSINQGTRLASDRGGECQECSTSKSVNVTSGVHCLPDEILLMVFKYLDMPTLCRSAQVDKQFYRVASDATLHKRMNFRPYWHSLRSVALLALATKCRLLQKLDLSWCGSHAMIEPDNVVFFLKHSGAKLTHLRMDNCKFVDDSVLEAIVTYAPNLEELSLRSVIVCMGWSVLQGLKKLKTLDLYGTNINTEAAAVIILSNPGLQHLNLGCCKRISAMDEVAYALALNCPEITSVDFLKSTSLTQRGTKKLVKKCKKLQKVTVGIRSINTREPGDIQSLLPLLYVFVPAEVDVSRRNRERSWRILV